MDTQHHLPRRHHRQPTDTVRSFTASCFRTLRSTDTHVQTITPSIPLLLLQLWTSRFYIPCFGTQQGYLAIGSMRKVPHRCSIKVATLCTRSRASHSHGRHDPPPPIQYTPWAEGFSFASLARPGSIIMLVAFGLFAAGWICLFWNVCQQGPEGDDPEISDQEVQHLCLRLLPGTIHTAWHSHTRTAAPYTLQKDSDSGSDSDSESGSGSDSESGSETGSDSGSEVRAGFVGSKKANTRNAMQCRSHAAPSHSHGACVCLLSHHRVALHTMAAPPTQPPLRALLSQSGPPPPCKEAPLLLLAAPWHHQRYHTALPSP